MTPADPIPPPVTPEPAPGPEGMSEERLADLDQRVKSSVFASTWFSHSEVEAVIAECRRLRADGATLLAERNRLRALADSVDAEKQIWSFASFMDGIDSQRIQDRVYEFCIWHKRRVEALEADGATLRERVDTLERGLRVIGSVIGARELTDGTKVRSIAIIMKDNLTASAPKEPTRAQVAKTRAEAEAALQASPLRFDLNVAFVLDAIFGVESPASLEVPAR